jgi:hypothetical protein
MINAVTLEEHEFNFFVCGCVHVVAAVATLVVVVATKLE